MSTTATAAAAADEVTDKRGAHWTSKRGTEEAPHSFKHVTDWARRKREMLAELRKQNQHSWILPWEMTGAQMTGNRAKCVWMHLYKSYTEGIILLHMADDIRNPLSFYGFQGFKVLKAEVFNRGLFPMPSSGFEDMVDAGTPFAKATIVRAYSAVGFFEIDDTEMGFDPALVEHIRSQYAKKSVRQDPLPEVRRRKHDMGHRRRRCP